MAHSLEEQGAWPGRVPVGDTDSTIFLSPSASDWRRSFDSRLREEGLDRAGLFPRVPATFFENVAGLGSGTELSALNYHVGLDLGCRRSQDRFVASFKYSESPATATWPVLLVHLRPVLSAIRESFPRPFVLIVRLFLKTFGPVALNVAR